jgi:hypothetical protein
VNSTLEVPISHQFLTGKFDNFLLIRLRAGSDDAVNELLLLFCCSEVDESDKGL